MRLARFLKYICNIGFVGQSIACKSEIVIVLTFLHFNLLNFLIWLTALVRTKQHQSIITYKIP
jgi:hypothetical protein